MGKGRYGASEAGPAASSKQKLPPRSALDYLPVFSRRRTLDGSRRYTREFFQALQKDLGTAGFTQLEIILPHNVVNLEESVISPEELLKRDRNYPALILRAHAKDRGETLKILFVNRRTVAVFADDTFPNGVSEPPQLYFQSPDPGRTFAVFEFFHEYLQHAGRGSVRALVFASFGAFLLLASETISFLGHRTGALAHTYGFSPAWDVVTAVLAVAIIFRASGQPKGLWVKPTREIQPYYLLMMALRGELRDNPLVTVIVAVLTTILTALLLRFLGLSGSP